MGNENPDVKDMEKDSIGSNNLSKPKCPYYTDTDSELACPYFMLANRMGPGGMAGLNGRVNWAGITSLILGIVAICLCWVGLFLFPGIIIIVLSILAMIFGSIGLRISMGSGNGRVSSWAGLTLGILSLIFTVFFLSIRLRWWY